MKYFACMFISAMYVPGAVGKQKAFDPWNWNNRWLWGIVSILGMVPAPLQEQRVPNHFYSPFVWLLDNSHE